MWHKHVIKFGFKISGQINENRKDSSMTRNIQKQTVTACKIDDYNLHKFLTHI